MTKLTNSEQSRAVDLISGLIEDMEPEGHLESLSGLRRVLEMTEANAIIFSCDELVLLRSLLDDHIEICDQALKQDQSWDDRRDVETTRIQICALRTIVS